MGQTQGSGGTVDNAYAIAIPASHFTVRRWNWSGDSATNPNPEVIFTEDVSDIDVEMLVITDAAVRQATACRVVVEHDGVDYPTGFPLETHNHVWHGSDYGAIGAWYVADLTSVTTLDSDCTTSSLNDVVGDHGLIMLGFAAGLISTEAAQGTAQLMAEARGHQADLDFLGALNALAGTNGLGTVGALRAMGATGGEVIGCINELAGTTGLELDAAMRAWAATGNF